MSKEEKFGKFGKFNKPGEFEGEVKEAKAEIAEEVKEEAVAEEKPTVFGKPRIDEVTEVVETKEGEPKVEDIPIQTPKEIKSSGESKMFGTVRETKASTRENIERTNSYTNNNYQGGNKTMIEGRKADIISLRVNVRLGDISAFLQGEIGTPFDINLKEFSPERELQTVDENDRKNMEVIIKKIVAYGEDNSYLSTVPVITVDSKYLKAPIDDLNLIAIGIIQEKPSLEKFSSKYCVPHIVDRAGGQSDVFLDTATVVTLTACELLNNCINKDDILNRNSQYAIAITFNRRDGYTVEFGNKNYREVR
nr:MAG TPA: hypothetical protein [Caudoviricetes sp.]